MIPLWRSWGDARVQRFIYDWNDGLEDYAMREKYGVRQPSHVAKSLRAAGYVLEHRRPVSISLRGCVAPEASWKNRKPA